MAPPRKRPRLAASSDDRDRDQDSDQDQGQSQSQSSEQNQKKIKLGPDNGRPYSALSPSTPTSANRPVLPSPWRMMRTQDLGSNATGNQDSIQLGDLIGNAFLCELWDFNFMHDVEFLIGNLHPAVRQKASVHVVHGFRSRDESHQQLTDQASRFDNVMLHQAPMPEMFGTHHAKMLIAFSAGGTASIIIHTANMIAKDWVELTNGAWISPTLRPIAAEADGSPAARPAADGPGVQFQQDLLRYLGAYQTSRRIHHDLVRRLAALDFSPIRAVLIASTPARFPARDGTWGWPALQRRLRTVPCRPERPRIVMQVSSIATLGPTPAWLTDTLGRALSQMAGPSGEPPRLSVVFPTVDEVRDSGGYSAGLSIHTKIRSAQQLKQLGYLRSYLCHWANDSQHGKVPDPSVPVQSSCRDRAAPHIKTYIRFAADGTIDWALLTSANLSKQAWGDSVSRTDNTTVRIASWELGVLVWPELLAGTADAKMVPSFPTVPAQNPAGDGPVVALQIPYSLPLQKYGPHEIPWVATAEHTEPDRYGRTLSHS